MDIQQKLEVYYNEEHQYKTAINQLRNLVLKTELEETYKWNFPTYTINDKNVLAICKFNSHFGIWFFNGVFLTDTLNVLENAQQGKTKAMRHWKFSSKEQIIPAKILLYIQEAIENQKKGFNLKVKSKKAKSIIEIPQVLVDLFKENKQVKSAFDQLTDYKKREYIDYISTAKQEKTKINRLAKVKPLILNKIGLNDKYR